MPQKCKAKVLIVFSHSPLVPAYSLFWNFSILFHHSHTHIIYSSLNWNWNWGWTENCESGNSMCWINMVCLTWEIENMNWGATGGSSKRNGKETFSTVAVVGKSTCDFDSNLFYLICEIFRSEKKVDRRKLFLCHAMPCYILLLCGIHSKPQRIFSSHSALLMVDS